MSAKTEDVEAVKARFEAYADGTQALEFDANGYMTAQDIDALRTLLASHAAQAERIASLEAGLSNLVRDSLANDFNNRWDSYTDAVALLSGKASA